MNIASILYFGLRVFGRGERGRRFSGFRGAIAGVALGLVPLIVVLEVADGMIEGITSRYVEVGTFHFQARPLAGVDPGNFDEAVQLARRSPAVTEAVPVYEGLGLAFSQGGRTGVAVRALPADLYAVDPGFRRYLSFTSGAYDLAERDSVLLSSSLARTLHASTGDRIRLVTALTTPGGAMVLRPNALTVRGVYSTGYNELDSLTMLISLAKGEELFRDPNARFIGIKVADPFRDLQGTSLAVQSALPPGWSTISWYELEQPMYRTFQTTKGLLVFVMILIVLVASVNVSSSLVMMVAERAPEIAILKSVGARPGGIAAAYIVTGFAIGIVGTAAGMALGLLVAVNINEVIGGVQAAINAAAAAGSFVLRPFAAATPAEVTLLSANYYLESIPIRLQFSDLGTVAFLSVCVSTAASWFPARRAGRIRPLDILRKS